MKLALFGITGRIGSRIALEALARGHRVTAVVRDPARLPFSHELLTAVTGDVLDPAGIAAAVAGHDAVLSAIGPTVESKAEMLVQAAVSLVAGLKRACVRRLVVGGAGSLEVAPGLQLVDTTDFPKDLLAPALAHRDALDVYRTADLDWTFVSPATLIEPGERSGRYRTGTDQLLTDEKGMSRISMEDYAVAFIDEVEQPRFIRRRMTVAY